MTLLKDSRTSRFGRLRNHVSMLAVCAVLGACQTTSSGSNLSDASSAAQSQFPVTAFEGSADDYVAQVAYWGAIHDEKPSDVDAAINYGRALRNIGQTRKAVTILNRAVLLDSENAVALSEYGKVLVQTGRVAEGADYLSRASIRKPNDWVILTAEGVAFDQMGDHAVAQRKYDAALQVDPGNPSILTNKGLSFALSGDLGSAEQFLRQAVRQPQATPQMRQNLALVLGLRGNFAEARQYAAADLSAAMVDNNMAYIREMIANESSPWSELQEIE